MSFSVKGHTFTLPHRFREGIFPSPSEAAALNYYITKTLKAEILAGNIRTRTEALSFIMGDDCLAPKKLKPKETADNTPEPLDLDISAPDFEDDEP